MTDISISTAEHLLAFAAGRRFHTVLADPPWRFQNRTGKVAPEHRRLHRYETLALEEIKALPVAELVAEPAHLYLWVPNALIAEGLAAMAAWGFRYKAMLVWHKVRKDGGSDGRCVGFFFRNVTESVLFGVRGKNARTLAPGRRQTNLIASRKREHSRKPDELYPIIEACSRPPFLELFARAPRPGWVSWGEQLDAAELQRSSAVGQRGMTSGMCSGCGPPSSSLTAPTSTNPHDNFLPQHRINSMPKHRLQLSEENGHD